jgi:ABC-2 type transport system permease protein
MIAQYRTLLRIYLAFALQYRVLIAIWAVAGVVQAFVSLAIWSAVAHAGALPASWNRTTFAAYFLSVMVVEEFTHTWIYWQWEWRVREGTFAGILLRPSHPIHTDVADNLGVKVVSLAVKAPIAVAIGAMYGVRLNLGGVQIAALVLALAGAYTLRVLLETTLACSAFWITRMQAAARSWQLAWAFLSGAFAPVGLLPQPLRAVAQATPMHWALAFPVDVALGRVKGSGLAAGLIAQAAWIAAAWLLLHVVWSTAQRRFTAVGS